MVATTESTTTKTDLNERQFLLPPKDDQNQSLTVVSASSLQSIPTRYFSPTDYVLRKINLIISTIFSDFSREEAQSTGFLFYPVGLGLGAILYFTAAFEPKTISIISLVLVLCFMLFLSANQKIGNLLVKALLIIVLGAACAKLQTWRNSTPMLSGEITTQVLARVISITPTSNSPNSNSPTSNSLASNSYRAVLEILETSKPTLKFAPKRARVTLRQGAEQLNAGDTIDVRLRLVPPSGPVRPSSYDFAFQSFFDGIGANGFSIGLIKPTNTAPPSLMLSATLKLEQLRQLIAGKIRAAISGNEAEVAVALIAGVQAGIDQETMEQLRLTGLAHILSISGLHMALVAGVFIFAIRASFALFPNFAAHHPVRKYAATVALLVSFLYLLLSGSDVAALRSFLMLAVFLIAILLDQKALTMRNVAIAALCILIVTPHEIMGPSFQMSFAATAALISAYAFWTGQNAQSADTQSKLSAVSFPRKIINFFLALAATSFIAGTATSLFSAWHFQRLAPLGLPTNLAATPPISLIIMPSAILSALAMPFGLEQWPLWIMGKGIEIMLFISNYFAKISSSGISGAIKGPVFVLLSCSLILLCLFQTRLRWLALIPIPIAFILSLQPYQPDIFVAQDARTVAVNISSQTLAVNRDRPNAFNLEAWQHAIKATKIVKPNAESPQLNTFFCQNDQCTLTSENGLTIGWVGYPKPQRLQLNKQDIRDNLAALRQTQNIQYDDRKAIEATMSATFIAAAQSMCNKADLLILEGPAPEKICAGSSTTVISAKDLALRGAAEVYFSKQTNKLGGNATTKPNFEIIYAIGEPTRPWNFERKFSRAARNMPPFQAIPLKKPQ